jgi:transposase InsO family protein
MKVSKSGFYKWGKIKEIRDPFIANLELEIEKIHTSSRGTYGSRRILSTLKKSFIKVVKKRVSKIMLKLNLNGVGSRKFKKTTKVLLKNIHFPNLLTGDFTAYKPNQIYTSDITYISTKEGWFIYVLFWIPIQGQLWVGACKII